MAEDSSPGTAVAGPWSMARRIVAVLTMVILVGLLLVLVWRVYLHHQHGRPSSEPAVVAMPYVARTLLFFHACMERN